MHGLWQGLLANLAVVAALVSLWTNIRDRLGGRGGRFETLAFGAMMSVASLLAMTLAVPVSPGVIFDLRAPPLAVAGFFGGPLAAAAAAGPALIYRAWLGGDGALAGCLAIIFAAGVAALLNGSRGSRPARVKDVLVLGVVVAIVDLLCCLALAPHLIMPTLLQAGIPSAVLDIVGVTVTALSVLGEERRRELVRTNGLHRAIIDALPDSLNIKDLDGRFIAANPRTARLMGAASAEALIGRTDFDFYPAATARQFRDDEMRALSRQESEIIEQQASFADGRMVWLSTLKVPLKGSHGEVVGLITHNRDVTAARIMASELQATRQHLADALSHMADGLVLYDRDGRIIVCNDQYRALFPLTADARVAGAALTDILRLSVERGEETPPAELGVEAWVASIVERLKTGGERIIALTDGRRIEARTRPLADGGCLTVFSDVTARKALEERLRYQAEHDPLTGLANRAEFKVHLARAHEHASKNGTEFAVMLIDLDHFKQVNDRFGHRVGDELLVEVGRRLEAVCHPGDRVARLGGDEFAIISEPSSRDVDAERLGQRVLDALSRPFAMDNVRLIPGGSVGYAVFPRDPSGVDALVAHADQALYAAKAAGRRRCAAYRPGPGSAMAS